MTHAIKAIPIISAAAFCAAVLAGPDARANGINGSIAFSSLGITVNNTDLADANSFTVTSPYVADAPTGAYSAVHTSTAVDFNGFTFNPPPGDPPVESVDPLWTFSYDNITYSFDATSVVADWNASRSEWDIGGTGMAMISGYTPTKGTWTENLSQTGASFAFDATSGSSESVPDSGSGAALLGGAVLGLGAFGRKFRF